MEEARSLELLADEAEIAPDRTQDYWALAADLITLVTDIEEFQAASPQASYEDPAMLALRRRLREISSRLMELTVE
jgi:hypothetical protein